MNRRNRTAAIALGLASTLALAACGDDGADTAAGSTATTAAATTAAPATTAGTTATTMAPSTTTGGSGSSTTMGGGSMTMSKPFGPACASVPTSGAGSFEGMAQDPAATAASNNPALSTLVTAVKAAGLVDTLNGPGPFTIFAPANQAFEAIPAATMNTVMGDPKGALTNILTYHVVAGEKMSAEDLAEAGTVDSVQGGTVEITGEGENIMINGAKVLCGNVQTANATVFIIDQVLMPPAS